jgi:prepilin-type N-terminal cleavage/methylation domain-containing protein
MRCAKLHIIGGTEARGRRGFTLMEMSFALIIIAMIMSAIAGISGALTMQWNAADQAQSIELQGSLATVRLEQVIRMSKYIGMYRTGSLSSVAQNQAAAIMLWYNDNDTPAGSIQFDEIALIQLNTTTNELELYEVVFPSTMTPAQKAAVDLTYSYSSITASNAPETFKAMQYVTAMPIIHNVTGCVLNVDSLGSLNTRPSVEYEIQLSQKGPSWMQYGVATLRASETQPP